MLYDRDQSRWSLKHQPTLKLLSSDPIGPNWSDFPEFSIANMDRDPIPMVLAKCHWRLPNYGDVFPRPPSIQIRPFLDPFGQPLSGERVYLHQHLWELQNQLLVPKRSRLRHTQNCVVHGCVNPFHWQIKGVRGARYNGFLSSLGPDPDPHPLSNSAACPDAMTASVSKSGPQPNHSLSVENDSASIDPMLSDFIAEIDGMRDLKEITNHFTGSDLLTEGEILNLFNKLPPELKERYENE